MIIPIFIPVCNYPPYKDYREELLRIVRPNQEDWRFLEASSNAIRLERQLGNDALSHPQKEEG